MSVQLNWHQLHRNAFEGKRAVITGGAGFIGSHLADALVQLGASVTVIDDLSAGHIENVPSGVELIKKSVTDPTACAFAGIDYVFHQAALASVFHSVEKPRDFHDVNITGTLNVLQAAAQAKVKRVMFAASSSAYGNSETLPKVETMPPEPLSPYAASKTAGESMMRAWANCYSIDTVCLRYFNIFGPRQSPDSAYAAVIAAFAKAMFRNQKPTIFGDGEQSRDFTYVANAVHANLCAARHDRALDGQILNVACGQRISLNHLAKVMRESLNRPDLTPNYQPARTGDVKHSQADLTRIHSTIGYSPIVEFSPGLQETLAWYEQALR